MKIVAENHKPTKRKNIKRWMESRLRRLDYEIKHGCGSKRQLLRADQLNKALNT